MDEQAYQQADTEQKLVLLETAINRQSAKTEQIGTTLESRYAVLNEFGVRLAQQGTRLDQLEGSMNRVLLTHNTTQHDQHHVEKQLSLLLTALIATASMSLGGLGISVSVLVVLLNHLTK